MSQGSLDTARWATSRVNFGGSNGGGARRTRTVTPSGVTNSPYLKLSRRAVLREPVQVWRSRQCPAIATAKPPTPPCLPMQRPLRPGETASRSILTWTCGRPDVNAVMAVTAVSAGGDVVVRLFWPSSPWAVRLAPGPDT